MLVKDMLIATEGKLINGDKNINIKNYIVDSREDTKDSFYIPLLGEKVDGHKFILDCVKNNIIGFYINKNYTEKSKIIEESLKNNPNIVIIEVNDTLEALYKSAVYNRNIHKDIPVVAITGSVGKSTTRQMIYSVVNQVKNTLVTYKNFNGYIGLSLMILKLDKQDICILEAGIDRFGEMEELSKLLLPDIAVVTVIGTAHIEKFKTQENIFNQKMHVVDDLRGINTLVINDSDKFLSTLKNKENKFNLVCYNEKEATDIKILPDGITFKTKIYGKEEDIKINTLGNHNISNALAAIKVGELLKISAEKIKKGLYEYRNMNGRMQIIKLKDNITVIDDTYNASFDSMKSGIISINEIEGNKIAVLGDMLQLGDHTQKIHEDVGKLFETVKYNEVITYGNDSKSISDIAKKFVEKSMHFSDMKELKEYLINEIKPNDIVYFKASNAMNFSELVKYIVDNY